MKPTGMMTRVALPALVLSLLLTVLLGFLYPALIRTIGHVFFPEQSEGSLLGGPGQTRGSTLLALAGTDSLHFHARPSACGNTTLPSGASNLSPDDHRLRDLVNERRAYWARLRGCPPGAVPADLVFASGSGLDPDISAEAARFQIDIIARLRDMSAGQRADLARLVEQQVERPAWFLIGMERVNVQELNEALDRHFPPGGGAKAGSR